MQIFKKQSLCGNFGVGTYFEDSLDNSRIVDIYYKCRELHIAVCRLTAKRMSVGKIVIPAS